MSPHLTQDHQGFIYWKGSQVEHWSGTLNTDPAKREAAGRELADRCEHLERLGLTPNTSNAVWRWELFADATPGTPWAVALDRLGAIYEHPGQRCLSVHVGPGRWDSVAFVQDDVFLHVDAQGHRSSELVCTEFPAGAYHAITARGFEWRPYRSFSATVGLLEQYRLCPADILQTYETSRRWGLAA